jgi:hypothetical protein
LAGETGAGKTSTAQLAAAWFGPALARHDAPLASWNSTITDLEILTAELHDVLGVVDDYLGTAAHERTADRLVRTATGAARGRRRADLTARPTYPPGGLIVSTGEDQLGRTSAQARALTLPCTRATRASEAAFNAACRAAESGSFAQVLAAYVQALAGDRERRGAQADGMPYGWDHDLAVIRRQVAARLEQADVHPRQLDIVVDLVTALARFVKWAAQVGALRRAQARRLVNDALDACCAAVADTVLDDAAETLALLGSALTAGRCHVSTPAGHEPSDGHLWGWHDRRPTQPCVGYLREQSIDLLPDALVEVIRAAQSRAGQPVNITRQRLGHLWADRGWLARNTGRRTFGERRRIGDRRLDVWPLPLALFNGPDGAL